MSRDIRSFFTTISKKTASTEKPALNTSDDVIVLDTPEAKKKPSKNTKRKRIVVQDSDSEDDKEVKPAKTPKKEPKKTPKKEAVKTSPKKEPVKSPPKKEPVKTPKKEPKKEIARKYVTALEAFGNTPVKQTKEVIKEPELSVHDDDDFDKTLLELDEEELLGQAASNGVNHAPEPSKKEPEPSKKEPEPIKKEPEPPKKTPIKDKTDTPNKTKRKRSDNDEGSAATDEERHERKRHSAMLYQKYLNRSGPVHLGAKWIPKGKPECLKGLCFIITGVLESLEREHAENLIKEHGGRCTTSVSGKVNYMVIGDDAGPAKVEKAKKLGTKMISEDDLIDLICIKSGITNQNKKSDCSTSQEQEKSEDKPVKEEKKSQKVEEKPIKKEIKVEEKPIKKEIKAEETPLKKEKKSPIKPKEKKPKTEEKKPQVKEVKGKEIKKSGPVAESLQWVDKYKPKTLNEIIGQQGERSNVKKLQTWLENWQKNRARETVGKGIPRPSPWAKDDDGAYFRAALLSGSPGVGKTTTATLVCKHLGFDTVEFNASDTRNKKMVHNEVAQIIKSTSIAGYFNDGSAPTRRHVLLMDEVDGMSGNEDRGGIQELIAMIKTSDIPIICMCNDRQHPKIRTLANYCFDLRFSKPRLEQIRGAMMSICFKEGIKIKPDILTHIIQGTGQDVRQTLNQLSLYSANSNTSTKDTIEKDVKLGPWEVIRKVFSEEEHKTMSLIDKAKLFFHDYSIGPLFVQENYLKVIPHCPKKDQLDRFASAADAISMGDVVDSKIRTTQNWSLLDLQSMYASVLPGHYLEGHFGGQIDFPGWLGKNSKANKFKRMLSEIQAHTRMSISGDRTAIGLDYVRNLRDAIATPMLKKGAEGIPESMEVMRSYNLLREDLTNLIELAHWPKTKDPFDGIESKVKAAFTRTYNKEAPALPYAAPGAGAVKSKRGGGGGADSEELYEYEDEGDVEAEAEEDDDITNDGMIKAKKATTKATSKAATTAASSSTTSKGKGKAKGGPSKRGAKK